MKISLKTWCWEVIMVLWQCLRFTYQNPSPSGNSITGIVVQHSCEGSTESKNRNLYQRSHQRNAVKLCDKGQTMNPLRHREMWDGEEKEHNRAEVLLWLLSSFRLLGEVQRPGSYICATQGMCDKLLSITKTCFALFLFPYLLAS